MKTALSVIAAAMLALVSFGDHADAQSATKPELKVGFVPGPYIDGFKKGVEPELKKKGYTVKYYEFSTGLEANTAVFKARVTSISLTIESLGRSLPEMGWMPWTRDSMTTRARCVSTRSGG